MVMIHRKIIIIFLSVVGLYTNAQSITGTQGQFFIPTAEMHEDRTLVLGAGYIPKGYFQRYDSSINPGMSTFVTVSILPFVEVMFRYTHELNMRVNPQTKYYPDRMFAGRIRLMKESKYFPSIVVGANDFTKALGLSTASTNYSATYAVATKSFEFKKIQFSTSFGYGFDVLELDRYNFLGFFGGVNLKHSQLKNSSISFEYDSKNIHFSLSHTFFDRIVLKAGLWDLNKPAGMIAYKYQLW
jgi:hypothetical protein